MGSSPAPANVGRVNVTVTLSQPLPTVAGGLVSAQGCGGPHLAPFPVDLRAWDSTEVLVQRVLEAVKDQPAGPGLLSPTGAKRLNAGQLLATLAYAYAIGLYGSEDIAEQRESEPGLHYLSAGLELDGPTLRRFRRAHRGPLSVALLRVLRSWLAARGLTGPGTPATAAGVTPGEVFAGTDPWMELCAVEAEARLTRAVFTDAVEMDF